MPTVIGRGPRHPQASGGGLAADRLQPARVTVLPPSPAAGLAVGRGPRRWAWTSVPSTATTDSCRQGPGKGEGRDGSRESNRSAMGGGLPHCLTLARSRCLPPARRSTGPAWRRRRRARPSRMVAHERASAYVAPGGDAAAPRRGRHPLPDPAAGLISGTRSWPCAPRCSPTNRFQIEHGWYWRTPPKSATIIPTGSGVRMLSSNLHQSRGSGAMVDLPSRNANPLRVEGPTVRLDPWRDLPRRRVEPRSGSKP